MNIIWCLIDSLKHVVEKIKRHISQGPDQTTLILTLGLSTTSIQNLRVNMLWSVNGTAKCIPVILFLPVYFFLISSWLGQDFYIITRPKSYFPYLPYLPLWAYFPGRNIPANSTGKYRGWNLPLNLALLPMQNPYENLFLEFFFFCEPIFKIFAAHFRI